MKKKILIVGLSLKIGGIERALIEQLKILDKIFDVDLLLFSPSGEYFKEVPQTVNIIKSSYLLKIVGLTQDATKNNPLKYLLRASFSVMTRFIGSKIVFNFIFSLMKTIGPYDYAISYFNDISTHSLYYGCNLFVKTKTIAKKKIAWIHADYVDTGLHCQESNELYSSFDKIVNVSFSMKNKFDSLNVISKENSVVVYNRYDSQSIISKSREYIPFSQDNTFKIVTIGRIESKKSILDLCNVAYKLKENGRNFVWYFIGKGPLQKECELFVAQHQLESNVIFTGALSNPYPYLKNADLYVSGSITETFGLTILEALVLNTPAIALKFDAIDEILNDSNGFVVDNFHEMLSVINNILLNRDVYTNLRNRTHILFDYNELNDKQIRRLLS